MENISSSVTKQLIEKPREMWPLYHRCCQKRSFQQFVCGRPLLIINLEGHVQKSYSFLARIFRGWRPCLIATDSENGLQLAAVREGMGAEEHLHDQTT